MTVQIPTMHAIPAEYPNPKTGPDPSARKKRDRAEFAQIVVLTSIPVVLLLAWCLYLWLSGLDATGWTAFFAGVLIFVTAHQAFYARRQWEAMGEQLDQMRLDQRAWIGPSKIVLADPRPGMPTRCKFTIKDTGKTPGTVDIVKDVIRLDDKDKDGFHNVNKAVEVLPYGWYDVQMVLPPGATMTLPFESAFRRDEHEIAMLSEGDLALAVVVYFEYLDVAGARHTTQSAYRYDYESKKLVAHQEHNKMT